MVEFINSYHILLYINYYEQSRQRSLPTGLYCLAELCIYKHAYVVGILSIMGMYDLRSILIIPEKGKGDKIAKGEKLRKNVHGSII